MGVIQILLELFIYEKGNLLYTMFINVCLTLMHV